MKHIKILEDILMRKCMSILSKVESQTKYNTEDSIVAILILIYHLVDYS
jgi:hypothetical protein